MHQIGLNANHYTTDRTKQSSFTVKNRTKELISLLILIQIIPAPFATNISATFRGTHKYVPAWSVNIEKIRTHHFDWEDNLRADNRVSKQTSHICLLSEMCDVYNVTALKNITTERYKICRWSFDSKSTEFRTDNCATHQIYSQQELFISMAKPTTNIGLKGVSGSSMVASVSTIRFTITDNNHTKHKLKLDNVIYLPTAAKNLISTTQWINGTKNVCGVTSLDKYSIFMWEHDSHRKLIDHSPGFPISPMLVKK